MSSVVVADIERVFYSTFIMFSGKCPGCQEITNNPSLDIKAQLVDLEKVVA